MRLIKRYANRKLYDTTTKNYVTLDAVGTMVSRGEEIQVLDNDTNEDLTSVVLSQLLLEREREQRFLPSTVLSQLWRAGKEVSIIGQSLSQLTRPFGPGSIRQLLDQEIELAFKTWLDIAEDSEEEILRLLENLIERRKQARHNITPPARTSTPDPENKARDRVQTNPVEAVGSELARRLGFRRKLDNFEDWSGRLQVPKADAEINSLQQPPVEETGIQHLEKIQASIATLQALDPVSLEQIKPELIAIQNSLNNLVNHKS